MNPVEANAKDDGEGVSLLPTLPSQRVEQLREIGKDSDMSGTESDGTKDGDFSGASDIEANGQRITDKPFVAPDDETKDKIKKQVEFYFSDANILKDAFLLKHVRRNKQGYVSLKLITSFKKVKMLSRDFRVVAYSLKDSETVEVNEEGNKVRRQFPLPDYDETTPSRTVVAMNLPDENPTIVGVSDMFKSCGETCLVRIIRPGKPIPPDVRKHISKHPELGSKVCAVVEFERHEDAKKACETMSDTDNWRKGMRVALLATPKTRKDGKEGEAANGPIDRQDSQDDSQQAEVKYRKKRPGKKTPRPNSRVEQLLGEEEIGSSSSETESEQTRRTRTYSGGSDRGSMTSSPARKSPSPRGSPQPRRRASHGLSPLAQHASSPDRRDGSPASPWVQRRLKAAQSSPLVARRNEGILRQPRGPDGTRGFDGSARGRGRPVAAQ